MPGYAGRRVFLWRQIRFRIIFDVPNIFISTEYWERRGNARQFANHRITSLPAPFDPPSVNTDTESAIHNHSEACWVAFARQVSHVCPSAVRVGLMAGDADRLPADIPVVPMQVSLRDIIALGLMIGMNIQVVSHDYIEMSGPFGFIKSSSHPILGTLIHFSAFSTTPHIKGLKTGDISKSWLRRLIGIASVAKQQLEEPKRRSHAAAMMRWRTNSTRAPLRFKNLNSYKRWEGGEVGESQLKFVDLEGKEHTVPADKCSTWPDLVQFLESNGIATAPYIVLGPENKAVAPNSWKALLKDVRKGDLKTIFKIAEQDYVTSPLATPLPSQQLRIKEITDQQIPPDVDNVRKHATRTLEGSAILTDASLTGSTESITRADSRDVPGVRIVENPPSVRIRYRRPTVEDYKNGDSRSPSPRFSHRFHEEDRNGDSRSPSPRRRSSVPSFLRVNRNGDSGSPRSRPRSRFSSPFREERFVAEPSLRRENSFDSERKWRDKQTRAYASRETPEYRPDPPQLTFYWASQIDIELGCWATPWRGGIFVGCIDALGMMVDIGLAGLSQAARLAQSKADQTAVDSDEIVYAEFPGPIILGDLWLHLREGEHTWPPYAINARGGVRGLATHSLVQHSAFRDDERLPQLTLLSSVHKAGMSTAETSTASQVLERDRILELASIDFWLSHAAATNSISKGKSNLILNTPAIVEEIWLEFYDEIMQTREELWNPGGGDMHVRNLANSILDFLCDFLGSPAEIYFVWVAFLRAVKVMECVANGPATYRAFHIFRNDILVYLV